MTSVRTRQPARPPAASLREHIVRTLRLAGPVIATRCGLLIMVTVDTVMTGRAGSGELAYLAAAFAPHITLMVTGIGFLAGAVILVSQADGAGRRVDCGRIMWIAMANGVTLGLVWAVILFQGEAILLLFGQDADLSRGGGHVMGMFAWGMPGLYLFTACSMFLEGIGRVKPGMVVTLVANLVNAGLNWVMIYGHLGFEPGGAAGAVLATSMTRWFMFLGLFGYILVMADSSEYGVFRRVRDAGALQLRFLRLGAPMALSYALETGAFTVITMMAGYLGAPHIAAFQAVMNINAFCFMVAIGMSTATAVRVGNAVGRQDRIGMARAGWVGTGLIFLAMLPLAAIVLLFPGELAGVYTRDAEIVAIMVAGLFAVVFLIPGDGLQAVLVGALRGAADVWPATWLGLVSFWGVMVPMAWYFSQVRDFGVPGLLWAEFIGITLAAALLAWRFHAICRRDIRPFS